jgi:hypothetical protein
MWNKPTTRQLGWALLLSVLVHWAAFGQLPPWLWRKDVAYIPIEVQLAQVSPPSQPTEPPAKPLSKAELPSAEPLPQPELTPSSASEPEPQLVEEVVSVPVAEQKPEAIPAPVTQAAALPQAEEKADVLAYVFPEDDPTPATPHYVEIDFRILHKGSVVGVERQRFQVNADSRYTLSSVAEAKGLLALALSDLVQQSEGAVTDRGLKPENFRYQYGRNADKAQVARFIWQSGTLELQNKGRSQNVPLREGVQDLMSFMYQFMYTPPLEQMQLSITNGKRLKNYDYGFEGEESLQTAMGALRCIHISHSNDDGEEKTEIWLAADYHYLPVKISKTEKDGTLTERIATRLQIE